MRLQVPQMDMRIDNLHADTLRPLGQLGHSWSSATSAKRIQMKDRLERGLHLAAYAVRGRFCMMSAM